jgi:hypothetical protein
VFRRVAPAIGLFVGLVPALAHAQTSIDQGKTPAEIFAIDCATCHKSPRGLAHGKSSSELASFLAEHYTSSKDQASALAAYVMGAGGGDAAPTQAHGPKTPPDHTRTSVEEAKPSPSTHPAKPTPTGKPEDVPAATAKLRPEEEKKPPVATQPATAARNRRKEPEPTPGTQPPAIVAEPAPSTTTPVQDASPPPAPSQSATGPANTDSGETAPVPRDDIPD